MILLDDLLAFLDSTATDELIEYINEMKKEAQDIEKEFIEKRDKEEILYQYHPFFEMDKRD